LVEQVVFLLNFIIFSKVFYILLNIIFKKGAAAWQKFANATAPLSFSFFF